MVFARSAQRCTMMRFCDTDEGIQLGSCLVAASDMWGRSQWWSKAWIRPNVTRA
jgi:hypothetical protein